MKNIKLGLCNIQISCKHYALFNGVYNSMNRNKPISVLSYSTVCIADLKIDLDFSRTDDFRVFLARDWLLRVGLPLGCHRVASRFDFNVVNPLNPVRSVCHGIFFQSEMWLTAFEREQEFKLPSFNFAS